MYKDFTLCVVNGLDVRYPEEEEQQLRYTAMNWRRQPRCRIIEISYDNNNRRRPDGVARFTISRVYQRCTRPLTDLPLRKQLLSAPRGSAVARNTGARRRFYKFLSADRCPQLRQSSRRLVRSLMPWYSPLVRQNARSKDLHRILLSGGGGSRECSFPCPPSLSLFPFLPCHEAAPQIQL